MLLRRAAILAVVLIVLLASFAFWSSRRSVAPFSSPTVVRTNDAYIRAHAPPTNIPPFTKEISAAISIQRSPTSLTVTHPSGESPFIGVDYGSIGIHKIQATETIQIGEGSIRLAYIGAATRPPTNPGNFMMSAPTQFYTADLKPITRADPLRLLMLQRGPQDLVVQQLPGARFIFACSNIAGIMPLGFRVFDARTHYTLSTNYNYGLGSMPGTFTFNADLTLWHQTPLELVGTVATGPTQSYTLSPAEGSEVTFPGGVIKVLAVTKGAFQEVALMPNSISCKIVPEGKGPAWPEEFSLMFFCWPRAYQRSVDFEFYDDSGNQMRGFTRALTERIAVAEVQGSLTSLKEIRLRHYPNLHRLVVTIPELPGLPEQNRNLKNLFDVHIPYVRTRPPYDIQKDLSAFVQMQIQHLPLGRHAYSNTMVAQTRTNVTARDLFEELDGCLPYKSDQLVADPEKNEISMRRHFLTAPMNFVKRIFRMP